MTTMMDYILPDGKRSVAFAGELLAEASSDDGKAQRWLDLELYRTDTGRYVVHRTGRSVVYHAMGSQCTKQAEPTPISELIGLPADESLLPCVRCNPPDIYDTEFVPEVNEQLLVEQDRNSVTVCEKATGVIDSLHGVDRSGTRFLSRVAYRLLEQAVEKDSALREAWQVEKI